MKHRGLIATLTCSVLLASMNQTTIAVAATVTDNGPQNSAVVAGPATDDTVQTAAPTQTTTASTEATVTTPTIPEVKVAIPPLTIDAFQTPVHTAAKPLLDVDFSQNKLIDKNDPSRHVTIFGQPKLGTTATMADQVALFDGQSAYALPLTGQVDQLANGFSMEAYFKYDGDMSQEHEIFSSQEAGGFGLGVKNGKVTFFAHVGDQYKAPSATLQPGRWVHAVGVYDQYSQVVKLYLDGQLAATTAAPGTFKAGTEQRIVLGGDTAKDGQVEAQMTGAIKVARVYDQVLTGAEIQQLDQTAQIGRNEVVQPAESKLVGSTSVVKGHVYGLNVHVRQLDPGRSPEQTTIDVTYDPAKFEYVGATAYLGGPKTTTVTKVKDGLLQLKTTAFITTEQFYKYAKTRLAHLNFKALAGGETSFKLAADTTTPETLALGADQKVTIQNKLNQDYNGDGVIGAGDVALAPKNQQARVAQEAEIKPYKHVIVLTTDGGGNPWDPSGIFYTPSNKIAPTWHTDPETMAKRTNTYTMNLFNKQFAMSTSAHAVFPTISAQNYISMLHGLPWANLPAGYQATNGIAGQEYFADFNQATPRYPSVFKVLQNHNPHQGMAVFSEWAPILNGITEPDAAVMTQQSGKLRSFDDVADYIGSDAFNDTSFVYMQSDYMDGQGHSKGFYNDNYWQQYGQYDQLFKKVMDKLEATGHSHDTLVIANADHGGNGTSHGQDKTDPNKNIFIALGGETVASGRRLKGGSNADISALILKALQVPQPKSMTAQVFDKSAFLDQTELAQKQRHVESLELHQTDQQATLKLTQPIQEHDVRAVDLKIDLAGRRIDTIKVPAGTRILRQTVTNGTLNLTLSFDQSATGDIATIKFAETKVKMAFAPIALKQAMLGTADGQEILADLHNK